MWQPVILSVECCCHSVVFSQLTVVIISLVKPPLSGDSGHESTMWLIVCCWLQSQSWDAARPHMCNLAWHGPWSVWKRFSSVHDWCSRSKPGCWMEGSHTRSLMDHRSQQLVFSPCPGIMSMCLVYVLTTQNLHCSCNKTILRWPITDSVYFIHLCSSAPTVLVAVESCSAHISLKTKKFSVHF